MMKEEGMVIVMVDRIQKREVFVTKGIDKTIYEMKKVHFSIKLMEIVFIIISKGITVFFFTKEDKGNEREQRTRGEAE